MKLFIIILMLFVLDVERLANAIYRAENSITHPYGIMQKYKYTTPRQACINTIRHKHRDWLKGGSKGNFLDYLGSKYAPIGASNDPRGLNVNWVRNVRYHYNKGE